MAEQGKRIQFLQDALRKLAKAVREVSNGLIDLDKTISRITNTTSKFKKEVDETSKKTNKYKKDLKGVNDEQKKFGKNVDNNNKKSKGFGATLLKNIKTIISFYSGYLLLNGALRLAETLTVGAVKRFAELEAATARVGAVTGATNEELEALRKNTLDVAGATTFTAIEIAGLQTELGKLGFTSEQIQISTLAIANAAQALGVGLGDVAQKVGVSLRAFNLDASQAATVADVLTSAINGSALSFESFGTSIGYVAPIAGQLGISIEETAAAMGVLADSGFQASRIGTGLRKILLEVGNSGGSLRKTLEELKKEQLSLNDISELFGKTAVAQATVLLNNTDKLQKYTGEFGKLGSATQASAKQIDTLTGKFKLLNSAFDAFLIKLADRSTLGGDLFNRLFNFILPNSVEEQLAAFELLKENNFFQLVADSASAAAKTVVKDGISITKEAEATAREVLAARDKYGLSIARLSNEEIKLLESGDDVLALSEDTQKAYNGLIKEIERLIQSKKDDILATKGQDDAISQLTENAKKLIEVKEEDGKLITSSNRELIKNQKQAREANKIAGEEYKLLGERINTAKDELAELTKGTDEYKRKSAELERLKQLQVQISEFTFDEAEVEKLVKDIFALMARVSAKEIGAGTIVGDKGITVPLNLIPVIPPPEGQEEAFGFIDKLGLESLKSFQELALELEKQGVSLARDLYDDFATERLDNLQRELDAELDIIKQRYEIEGDILKSQLDNQLITESQFRQKQIELRKSQLRDENDIEKQRFNAEKQQDLLNARSDYLAALSQAFINEVIAGTKFPFNFTNALITSGGAAVAYAGQAAAISQRRFIPRKFAEGGMVEGPSHAEGGVPFSVQGRGGYEMEGGEFIVNKKASAMHRDLLERINSSYKVNPIQGTRKFATGGLVGVQTDESVDYLKAIAEATTSTAIGVSKPVRAYVSDKDLRGNATERRIRDRNDRI